MSTVLGFDTATDDVAVAVVHDGEPLYEAQLGVGEQGGPRHTTGLLGEVEGAVAAAGGWEAIGRIAVGVGPGSFTGIRVGIASAKALGLSRTLPVAGVCTLDALAAGIGEVAGERDRLAVNDARRGEIFVALYSAAGERLWEPLACRPEVLAERIATLERPTLCAGSGAVRFRQQLASRSVEIPDGSDPAHRVAARHVCALAAMGSGEGPGAVDPIYLRPPDAERWRERGTVKKAG